MTFSRAMSSSRTPTTPSSSAAARWRAGRARGVRCTTSASRTGPQARTTRGRRARRCGRSANARCVPRPSPGRLVRHVPRRGGRLPRSDAGDEAEGDPGGPAAPPRRAGGARPLTPVERDRVHQPLRPQGGGRARALRRDAGRADAGHVPGARGGGSRAVRDPEPLPVGGGAGHVRRHHGHARGQAQGACSRTSRSWGRRSRSGSPNARAEVGERAGCEFAEGLQGVPVHRDDD